MKSSAHTSIVGIKWDKEHQTRHGLHLNKKGKKTSDEQARHGYKELVHEDTKDPNSNFMVRRTGGEVSEGYIQGRR
jgi:hypothetical protein